MTSTTDADLASAGVTSRVDEQVVRLASLAHDRGCDGVVASPAETADLRALLGPAALIVTPGVSLSGSSAEHARTAGPAATIRAGANHVVLGRGVTRADDPVGVLAALRAKLLRPATTHQLRPYASEDLLDCAKFSSCKQSPGADPR